MRVGKSVDAIDPPGMPALRLARDLFGGHADTADCGQDPDLVACRGTAIGAEVALPAWHHPAGNHQRRASGTCLIGQLARQRRRQIVAVDMVARGNRPARAANRLAILHHDITCGEIGESKLVAPRHGIAQRSPEHPLARRQIAQGYGNRIRCMHTQRSLIKCRFGLD